jgi:hypothetical protein
MLIRLSIPLALGVVASAAGSAFVATPASAQKAASEIIVYGTDPCPRSTDDQIYVCSRRPESERFRLPKDTRPDGTPQQRQSWAQRSQAINSAGATGIGSCSAVGPGGFTGCLTQEIQNSKKDRREMEQQSTAPER